MRKKKNWFLLGIYILVVVINGLSWYNRSFGDKMRQSIFQVTQFVQGHISSLCLFSVGEFLLALAVLLAAGAVLLPVVLFYAQGRTRKLPLRSIRSVRQVGEVNFPNRLKWISGNFIRAVKSADVADKVMEMDRKPSRFAQFVRRYLYMLLWIVGLVSIIMSINCFLLYHCSSFQEKYMSKKEREYKVKELALLRDYVVRQCNALAEEMERDEKGQIVYQKDVKQGAITEMKGLGKRYPLLDGYYPMPKKLALSGFFSQQYIMGYYFPFSMEANYNGMMYIANVPVTICHELSHVKGFIYEDDANFIGYLACISSQDAFFQYSGYLSVLDYLNTDLYESLGRSLETYLTYEKCSPLVESDNVFLTKEAWEEVESRALIDTEIVKQASLSFLETNLQINGIEEGIASYGNVVKRMLVYYDGILY